MMKRPKKTRLACIDEDAALQYINDNFSISGEAQRMCAGLFRFAGLHGNIARGMMLEVLDGIGFGAPDLDRMSAKGILFWD